MEYLREFIKDNEEAIEFWNAVQEEIDDYNDEITDLKREIESKDDEIKDLESDLAENYTLEDMETIDCGIGIIEYRKPDNMKLEILMDEFKEKQEQLAYH